MNRFFSAGPHFQRALSALVSAALLCGGVSPAHALMEVGTNDFRVSHMGPDGDTTFGGGNVAVAYNSQNNEYLAVWEGEDDTGGLVNNEFEIFGQRISGLTGALLGPRIRVSDMGPDGGTNFFASNPSVAYNSRDNEYLVVWDGQDNVGPLVQNESEIFGQRLRADGTETGTNDFRISDMGPDGNTSFVALQPSLAYNSRDNEYLVAWIGDDNTAPMVNDETEVFGQRVRADGVETGTNDFRISDMGPDGSTSFGASDPTVAYNSQDNEYLVAWGGDDNTGSLVDNEFEIFAQRLTASGTETGTNDLRVSDMGPDGSASFQGQVPSAAYNTRSNEFLVVWVADDNTGSLINNELEIFAQRLTAGGVEVGSNDFRVSDMGPDGSALLLAQIPSVAYNSGDDEYLVVWDGEDDTGSLANNGFEAFGQRLSSSGVELGGNDFRISDMGPDLDTTSFASLPSVAYNSRNNGYLVLWSGEDGPPVPPALSIEHEVYAQRLGSTGSDTVSTLKAYPNPFRPGRGHTEVTITDLPSQTTVRIYTWAGRLVRELRADETGTAPWDGKNDDGEQVASGVYLVQSSGDGGTKIVKVAVQR